MRRSRFRQQILFFQEQGYALSHQPLFAPEKFAELQAIFEEQLALKGAKLSDELDTPHFRNERLLTFLLSDEVLDLVEPLIGPNIALWSSHFICKDPYTGRATPWHEDSAFWKGRCSAYDKIVTVWLAIEVAFTDQSRLNLAGTIAGDLLLSVAFPRGSPQPAEMRATLC